MSSKYPRGSEWRKWDLHVHTPHTKASNGYSAIQGEDVWDTFCDKLEASDVQAFGITDYFSVDNYFTFTEKFKAKYPDSSKVFFPNVELRLNESVNQEQQEVNLHLIFRPDITQDKLNEFLRELKTELTDSNNRKLTCAELTGAQYTSATVTRENIKVAIKNTFGEKANQQDFLIIVTAANNDGVRPASGSRRKENITDQIDKFSDAYFGGIQNTDYFLKTDRLEDDQQTIEPKPVFSGSDAHSFDQLDAWLGRQVRSEETSKDVTWIKSDPTFDGLQQTLIEPSERVSIQATKPDEKEPYKYISKIKFSGSNVFPEEIVLNNNLCSIIGSRSSGKSALLAYVAHAISSEDTIDRQIAAQEGIPRDKMGPAAGKTWSSVSGITCKVEWGTGQSEEGKVIYIPQNYLFSISKRPSEITKKIEPVLFNNFPAIKTQHDKTIGDVTVCSTEISNAVSQWFTLEASVESLQEQIKNLGDKTAIQSAKDKYQEQIDELKTKLSLSQAEIELYQQVVEDVTTKRNRQTEITNDLELLAPFISSSGHEEIQATNIRPTVTFLPTLSNIPEPLLTDINQAVLQAAENITNVVGQKIVAHSTALNQEKQNLQTAINQILVDNKELIDKNKQNNELSKLVDNANKQTATILAITEKETQIAELKQKQVAEATKITTKLAARTAAFQELSDVFESADQLQAEISFGVEIDYNPAALGELSDRYNLQENSPFIKQGGQVDIEKVKNEVTTYLEYVNQKQKFKAGQNKIQVAKATLCLSEEIRFNATLEGDMIGGFSLSSMTPGKQALFALTLILNESEDAWPLLIDQPEDDLDSRSMYEYIVPYLMLRKKERQILMVSHNANLVVGADSEQLIIANRHGDDRKNRNSRTFDYLTGSLEHSKEKIQSEYTLEACGIREHACEVLDGGKEAFEKRKNKYKL